MWIPITPSNFSSTGALMLAGFSFIYVAILYKRHKDRLKANPCGRPLPPGPPPLPIIGNLFDLTKTNEIEVYGALAEKYGDLVYLNVLGTNILFVNSHQAANDLFEKRSANYSDRVHSTMLHELMGWEWTIGHMPYGEQWKIHRKMFHRQFSYAASPIHWPVQRKEAHALLRRLLASPNDLFEHLRHNAASMIMNVTYGLKIQEKDDRFISIAEKALAGMAEAANPGAFLVDIIPILKYVPEWVPGAGFQRKAKEWKDAVYEMRDAPYGAARQAYRDGRATSCFVSNLASELETNCKSEAEFEHQMEVVKKAAGMSYAAGTESTMSALASFILAVILHPDVLVKAQEEIDCVIGHDRLPEFEDRKDLPYIGAIVKEVLRWAPIAPLGLPHMVTADDEYRGYFIPKGTIIIGNTWNILHDPQTYPNPDVFNPDRFLASHSDKPDFSPSDPLSTTFGYGRRICPGRHLADAQIFLTIASIVQAFDIGCDGQKPEPRFTSGMIRNALPYKYSIKPRGEWARQLIQQTIEL